MGAPGRGHLGRRLAVMACCWTAYVLVYLLRSNLSVALPYIEAEFGISRASLGLLSSVFLWVYGLGQLANGWLGDRISAKWFMLLGLGMSAMMNLALALARGYMVMVLCWAVNGWFQSMLWGPISKTIANWYSPEESGGAMIAISTSTAVGALLSMLLSGALVAGGQWRNAFLVPALIGCLYLAVHVPVFRDRPSERAPGAEAPPAERPGAPMSELLRRGEMRAVTIASFCQGIVRDGITLWSAMFFMEAYGLDIKRAVLFMLMIPAANFASVLGVGRLLKRFPLRLMRLAALVFLGGTLLTGGLLFLWRAGATVAMVLLALASAMMCAANTLLLGVYPLHYAAEGRVSSVAGYLEFCAYMAAGCTAVLSGVLLDRMGGWQGVIVLWLGVSLVGALALIAAERLNRRDGAGQGAGEGPPAGA